MSKILGIDYGSSKVGLALGDTELKLATPFKVIPPAELVSAIEKLVEREELAAVVMGLPVGLDGRETEQTRAVREFADRLKKEISVDLEFEDERLSTAQARKEGYDDAVAAMHILQSYLDRIYG